MNETKHDGKLDEGTSVQFDGKQVAISGYWRGMLLTPKQALSLLAWLRQEESKLEELAKEQTE